MNPKNPSDESLAPYLWGVGRALARFVGLKPDLRSDELPRIKRGVLVVALLLPFSVQAGELKLSLHGKEISGKHLYVAVHASAQRFLGQDDTAIRRIVLAGGDSAELVIPDVPSGVYAVAVFADSNGNGELDTNFIGIPKEPVGISRDAQGRFGPPKFADAAFKIGDGTTTQTIHLK